MNSTIKTKNKCELCETPTTQGLMSWHKICPNCSLETSELIEKINQPHNINEHNRKISLKPLRLKNFSKILTWIEQFHSKTFPSRPNLLEIGSAHGWFLSIAKNRYEALGIEPDKIMAQLAKSKNLSIRENYFPDALNSDELFDIIIFNDAIEHIPNIKNTIENCKKHLKSDGFIVINAPDSQGFFYNLSKHLIRLGFEKNFLRMWQFNMPSPHLYYLNSFSIKILAAQADLKISGCRSLPSVTTKGLFHRIHYSGSTSTIKSLGLTCAIFPLILLARFLKPDIKVWVLTRNSNNA